MNKHPLIAALVQSITNHRGKIRIGFPDGADPRILRAAQELAQFPNVETLVISPEVIDAYPRQKLIDCLQTWRGDKNDAETIARWASDPNYFAMSLVRLGELDCVVGGATVPTAELLRPALQIVGTRRKLVTSFFWMTKGQENLFLGDAAIVPEPNQAELVEIGQSVAAGVKSLFGIDPYLALLSFSTNGSGGQKLPSVLKVRQAAQELTGQGYRVLGETQFDAAYDAQTRLYKWNRSLIHAPNVYIFPNLDAANIGYKIMKLTGNYQAIGPIIVGLNRPVNDLSRGCDWREVYHLSLISLAMSISPKTQLTEELAVGHLDPAEKSERG